MVGHCRDTLRLGTEGMLEHCSQAPGGGRGQHRLQNLTTPLRGWGTNTTRDYGVYLGSTSVKCCETLIHEALLNEGLYDPFPEAKEPCLNGETPKRSVSLSIKVTHNQQATSLRRHIAYQSWTLSKQLERPRPNRKLSNTYATPRTWRRPFACKSLARSPRLNPLLSCRKHTVKLYTIPKPRPALLLASSRVIQPNHCENQLKTD